MHKQNYEKWEYAFAIVLRLQARFHQKSDVQNIEQHT